jgi:hypothetical protein
MTVAKKITEQASHTRAKAAVLAGTSLTADTKNIREKAGLSQAEAAALADTSLTTWRFFEVSPTALTPKKRAACQCALDIIRSKIDAGP